MVTGQASEHNLSDLTGEQSTVSTERLLNLLELSNSDLTASTGMEDLPVSEMLLDTLLGVLQAERPDLLAHSQRVAFLCFGLGRQFGWGAKRTNTLVIAALLHELGMLASPQRYEFWDDPVEAEELSRYVTIDLLETCHADSDLLEILAQSLNFRYREEPAEESDYPTPEHVLLGAAAFQFAHLFEKARHQGGGVHQVSEIVAALQNVAESPLEEQVVSALQEWLTGRDKIIHSFDPSMLFPQQQEMDEETAAFVRTTFVEILAELYKLQKCYDAFFIIDSTGRFQLWNSGCQLHHGFSIREMRNKHWHNSLLGYCNQEGLAFSDAQTPLFQTLSTAKAAHTTLYLKQGEHSLIEAEVISIPIMGRDKLMLGIVELHRLLGIEDQPPSDVFYTPQWISELASELRRLDDEDPAAQSIPELDDELISIIESRLGISSELPDASSAVTVPDLEQLAQDESSSHVDLDEAEPDAALSLDPADSDILTTDQVASAGLPVQPELGLTESETTLSSVESDTVSSVEPESVPLTDSDTKLSTSDAEEEEPAEAEYDFLLAEEESAEDELPELGSHLDELLSRFDNIVTDSHVTEDAEESTAAEETDSLPAEQESASSSEVIFESFELEEETSAPAEPEGEEAVLNDEEEAWEEIALSESDDDSDHVLESSLDLGAETAESTEPAEQGSGKVLEEDDVLAFLIDDDSDVAEVTHTPAQEEAVLSEELPEEAAPVEDVEQLELAPADTEEAGDVLDDELADFELDLDAEVTDSELMRALQEEGVAVDEEPASSTSLEESSAEEPAAMQVGHEIAESPPVESMAAAEETLAEPVEEPAEVPVPEEISEFQEEAAAVEAPQDVEEVIASEQVEEFIEEPVLEEVSELQEELAVEEAREDVVEVTASEQIEEPVEGPVPEEISELPEEPAAAEVPEEMLEAAASEQVEEPASAEAEEVTADTEEAFPEPVAYAIGESAAEETAEETFEAPVDEPVAEEIAEPVVRQVEEVAIEPISDIIKIVPEEPETETEEATPAEAPAPAAEEAEAVAEAEPAEPEPEPVLEAEPTESEEPEPVAVGAADQIAAYNRSESELQTSPVSRNEWDAFVSYLLDPDSEDHEQVAVLFLDLDRFKAINEGFGRQIGDDLLKEISRRLSEACGQRELSCRYGGGQFAICCPGLTLEKAQKRGDQVRKLVERTRFDVLPFQALTVSIGVASSEQGDSLNDLMNRAEHSLYNAKSSGRNCVVALSSKQIEAELAREDEEITRVATDKPFEVVAEFEAMIASDMIVYKLGGFLYDMHAKLLHVDRRHVSMRVGSKGILPYWGRQDDARPVLIDLELGEGWGDSQSANKPSKRSIIHIRIRPDGWVRNQETFYKRAQHVLRELKGYFAGS